MLIALEPADGEAILPLAKLKARVRVIANDDDADIERMRLQAIDFVERYSGQSLQSRSFQWVDKQFCRSMALPIGPVTEVTAISYFAADGTDTALDEAAWYVGAGMVSPAVGTVWPFASGQAGSVRITFTAGFADAENDAPALIAAVEVGVAALYENRENPDWSASKALADSYRGPGL
jgi:uncharacterized phiE125 gp8 family phage protein